jgi:hypothetical protein
MTLIHLLLAASFLALIAPAQPGGVNVTLTANEGVLLSAGDKKVLIDALFQEYEGYPVAPARMQQALARGQAPFDGVNLILVTHRHGDHFHPGPVAAHLRANRGATLVTSQQVIDSLRAGANFTVLHEGQVLSRTMPAGSRRREIINAIGTSSISAFWWTSGVVVSCTWATQKSPRRRMRHSASTPHASTSRSFPHGRSPMLPHALSSSDTSGRDRS